MSDDAPGMLGIHTERLPEGVLVTGVVDGSPAQEAGLAPGDLLRSADGRSLAGLQAPNRLLQGPEGAPVTVEVAGPLDAAPRVVTVHRAALPVPPRPRAEPPLPAPDLVRPDGAPVDLGGDVRARRLALASLVQADPAAARDMAAALQAVGRPMPEADALGLPSDPGRAWRAALPPVESRAVTAVDGSALCLPPAQPTIVAFWATWCAPCRAELPLLAAWARAHPEGAVWAVNVEDDLPADRLRAVSEDWGLGGARIVHDPSLGAAFGVTALPTTVVLGRDGASHHRVRGTSARAVSDLLAVAEAALEAPDGVGAPIGAAWGAWGAPTWIAVPGARSVAADAERVWVGVAEGPPVTWSTEGAPAPTAPPERPGPSRAVAPTGVVGDPGRLVLRAWGPDGGRRWMRTLPAPLQDLEAQGDWTWAAMGEGGAVALDAEGAVVARTDRAVDDLAPAADGGLWAVGGGARFRVSAVDGDAVAVAGAGPAPGAARVAADGAVGGPSLLDLEALPGGGWVALRRDGHLLWLDGAGAPVAHARLRDAVDLAVLPSSGAVAVALRDLGVVVVAPPPSEAP